MTSPRHEPITRVNAGGVIHELEPFLLRYRSRKHEIDALLEELNRGQRFHYGHPILTSIRFTVELDRMARVSADGLIVMSIDDVRRYTGLTPTMVDDLIRDMRKRLEERTTKVAPTPPPMPSRHTDERYIAVRWLFIAACLGIWLTVSIVWGFRR